ncbi:TRDMT1 [Symbiodinium microadriaticum]|nr:TRDMT1 [Symbiodinium sp. KB8]CAE7843851.1 TRDMT1 [Symbiodinium microadriaticum]
MRRSGVCFTELAWQLKTNCEVHSAMKVNCGAFGSALGRLADGLKLLWRTRVRIWPGTSFIRDMDCHHARKYMCLVYAGFMIDSVAVEVNQQALAVYGLNFGPDHVVNRDICSLTSRWFDQQQCRIWTMSPPCQPYTRQGKIRDAEDPRAKPLLHIISVLREVTTPPEAIVLENVRNFEQSDSYSQLCDALRTRGFGWRSFLLSPQQFGFPNARLRFYMVAKRRPLLFRRVPDMATASDSGEGSLEEPWRHLPCSAAETGHEGHLIPSETLRNTCSACGQPAPAAPTGRCCYELQPVSAFLDADDSRWLVPEGTMQKESARCFDVVHPGCRHSLCFTKAYGRYVDGTGSVLSAASRLAESQAEPGSYTMQQFYGLLRYFAPAEVARLLGFKLEVGDASCSPGCLPQCLSHPCSVEAAKACQCSRYQLPLAKPRELWGLLGNSLNPQVVALVCEACDLADLLPCRDGKGASRTSTRHQYSWARAFYAAVKTKALHKPFLQLAARPLGSGSKSWYIISYHIISVPTA